MSGRRIGSMAAALALALLAATAHAQNANPPPDASAEKPSPVAALDDATLARGGRATKLIGSHVYVQDSDAGKIADILIDRERAAVTAAILSVGGFLGIGEKLVAVPITDIKIDSEARFTLDMSRDDLKNAPTFDFARMK
ncbi:MAG TPA: PRC-barrel domain-containing protein, partial [Stellaceae bacterium]